MGAPYELVFLYFMYQALFPIHSRNLYVSHTGRDITDCGNVKSPCLSVRFTVEKSRSRDMIFVDHAQGKPYNECEECKVGHVGIKIKKSLTIIGYNGKAVIQCHQNCTLFKLQSLWLGKQAQLRLIDLVLSNSSVAIAHWQTNIKLVVEGSVFRNNFIGIYFKKSQKCILRLVNSSFHHHRRYGIVAVYCINSSFYINSSTFGSSTLFHRASMIGERPWQIYKMFISHCVFQGTIFERYRSSYVLMINSFAVLTNITIKDSIFKNHVGNSELDHLLFINDRFNPKHVASFIALDRLTFEDNCFKGIAIDLRVFQTKIDELKMKLTNSLFRNNTGTMWFYVPASEMHNKNGVTLENNTFLRNHYISNIPQYSILHFQSGIFHIISCQFINNLPGHTPTTGVVFVSDDSSVTLKDCYFENSQVDETSVQVYAYPNSRLVTNGNNTFNITALKDDQMIFIHLPFNILSNFCRKRKGFVQVRGVLQLMCPRGYRVLLERFTTPKKARCFSYSTTTYIAYSCSKCPKRTYSLERGKIFNNVTREIECHECPRGGQCNGGELKAKQSFWGYQVETKVDFIDCPRGYCCDKDYCDSYNTCSGNRFGTLCGRCPVGTSEGLFSTVCKPNKSCNNSVFFLGVVALLFGYIAFFLYHVEIVRFLVRSFWLIPQLTSVERFNVSQQNVNETTRNQRSQESESTSGCIKIIFYYYQTTHLLMDSAGFGEKHGILYKVSETVSQALDLIVTNAFLPFDCPFQNNKAVSKSVLLHSVGFMLLIFLGLLCVLRQMYRVAVQCLNRCTERTAGDDFSALSTLIIHDQERQLPTESCLPVRVASAFTHICLLMYSSTAKLCLTLLYCVPFKDMKILFIDGSIQCFQPFQHFLLGYVVVSVLPFCLVPFLGSYVLTLGSISVVQFCLGCLFPLPFSCHWLRLLLINRANINNCSTAVVGRHPRQRSRSDILQRNAILHVLSGPFRTHRSFWCFPNSPLPWEGVLIFRRLVLILTFTFTYDKYWRSIFALVICVIVLVTHLWIRPFKRRYENFLETLSLCTLVILCGFTIVKTSYRGEDYSSLNTGSTFMSSLNFVERIIIIAPLAMVVCAVVFSLLVRIILLFKSCFLGLR